ncbi:uncharacterized protein LOC125830089 [Solanum verrucosum]|uniref:uncharacterized protein LOC125830089 n=1 Tax=Solanum verrucosum TaxID=315347 RepID=UPI0020D00EB7|nr:uncharacterized protein LOC125830089 [Solanum verrucosum]
MFCDLRELYWWNGVKKDIAEFVAKCPNCQQVKVEHQRSGGLSQDIAILTWKWEDVNMDFIVGLPRTRQQRDSIWVIVDQMSKSAHFIPIKVSYSVEEYAKLYVKEIVSYYSSIDMAPFEALYGKKCTSLIGWFEVGEVALLGPESVHEAIVKIRVYLKISPMKGVIRFGKNGILTPQFMGSYEILRHVGEVAYELDLPNELVLVHSVFHVSMLKKCIGDPSTIVPLEGLEIKENHAYEEVPIEILDGQVKRLRNKEVASMKDELSI